MLLEHGATPNAETGMLWEERILHKAAQQVCLVVWVSVGVVTPMLNSMRTNFKHWCVYGIVCCVNCAYAVV